MDKEDVVYVYNGILLSHKKNETLLFAATWLDLEIIILGEVSQRKILYDITCMWNLKNYNKLVNIIKKKQTHIYRKQITGDHWGEERVEMVIYG